METTVQTMLLLPRLAASLPWREIRNCPGRFVVSRVLDEVEPRDVVMRVRNSMDGVTVHAFPARAHERDDDVVVVAFRDEAGGGLITYVKRRPDGSTTHVHTLNTPSGFERKLRGMGLFDAVFSSSDSSSSP